MKDNGLYKQIKCPICGCSTVERDWEIYKCKACDARWSMILGPDERKIEVVDQILKEIGIDNIGHQSTRGDVNYNCHVLYKNMKTIGIVLENKF